MKLVFAPFVGTILLLVLGFGRLPVAAAGWAVSLPFSTTYNCPEQAQGTSGWVSCDGIKSNGDWITSKGSKEQITTAANYTGGAGGRGQRHWIGQSSGNTNGSGATFFEFASVQQEVYIRWYTRWQAGLRLGGNAQPILRAEKLVYFSGGACGIPGGCVLDVEGTNWSFTIAGNDYRCGTGWDGLFGGTNNAVSDGRWMALELHLKNETGAQNNGVFQVYVDGRLHCSVSTLDFKGSTGFYAFEFPSNHQFTTVNGADMYQDLDDVAIRTTGPIGPLGGSVPPPAPGAPYNVRILR